ncbi:tautomerase family protein [Pseudonocardia lacus]|uniref:tautomerase family protein n=1 Tax=Pseudonocardia lacus TaxID=2835865 RepID=UPI001BDD328E|nr:tautomerase family protein [Pseudonocardia lacus]
MPHLQVRLSEDDVDDAVAARVIAELTEAIAAVYGECARPHAVVEIIGIPPGRWGVGGVPAAPVPAVTLSMRAEALRPPHGDARAARLIAELTGAVGRALGAPAAARTTVELLGVPAARSGVGGVPAA